MNLGVVILDLHLEPITRRNRKEALKLRVAAGMYKEFGFRFNGEKDIHGEDVMVKRYSQAC